MKKRIVSFAMAVVVVVSLCAVAYGGIHDDCPPIENFSITLPKK